MLLNVIAILGGFTLLIVIHELGHFLAARWAGIRVDGFAVGMGPVACSYRSGVGFVAGSTDVAVRRRFGRSAIELTDDELRQHGLGETEYSLRWLPIGGFVKMLGQDDLHPTDTATSQRSYLAAPIGRRMVVVSAGVIANAFLAVLLFMVAFLVGVRFEAPVLGQVAPAGPAAAAFAENGTALGVVEPGLRPGDRVLSIDGTAVRTFSDVYIAAAMAAPDATLIVDVERPGIAEPLVFSIAPRRAAAGGLLSIGVTPASSTRLSAQKAVRPVVQSALFESGLALEGVVAGATIESINGVPVETWNGVERAFADSNGAPVTARWLLPATGRGGDASTFVETTIAPRPELRVYEIPDAAALATANAPTTPQASPRTTPDPASDAPELAPGASAEIAFGVAGLVPLMRVGAMSDDSRNRSILEPGDVIVGIEALPAQRGGRIEYPRRGELLALLQGNENRSIAVTVLRDGVELRVEATTDRNGRLGIVLANAWELPTIARPVDRMLDAEGTVVATPIAPLALFGGATISKVGEREVRDWTDIWQGFREVAERAAPGEAVSTTLTVVQPVGNRPVETLAIVLSPEEAAAMRALGFTSPIDGAVFDPLEVTLTADGNPLAAVAMGFRETRKMIVMTYLTIARLFQRTVGVDQLRGPVGIVHLGSTVIDNGWAYGLLFLAMISVNLAVLNFLPLPIVDGGLFLYLIYEKLRGYPPPLGFQNAATMVGLLLIGTLFVVTFYNDVARLVG